MSGPDDDQPRPPRRPWFRVQTKFVEDRLRGMKTLAPLKVLLVLMSYANEHAHAWPSLDTLTEETGMHRANVARAIKELIVGGYIEPLSKGGGRKMSTRYMVRNSSSGATVSRPDDRVNSSSGATLFDGDSEGETVARAHRNSSPGALETVARAQLNSSSRATRREEEEKREEKREEIPRAAPAAGPVTKPAATRKKTDVDPNHRPLVEHLQAAWEQRHGRPRVFDMGADGEVHRGKDGALVARLLHLAGNDLATAKRVVDAYLADTGWAHANAHPLEHLLNNFNKYTGDRPVGSNHHGNRSTPDFSNFISDPTLPDGIERAKLRAQGRGSVRQGQAGGGAPGAA